MESCLTNRLSRFLDLSDAERDFIEYMERDDEDISRRHPLFEIGDKVENLHVLKFGWMIARSREHDGRRSIVRIYLPGEVIGLAEIGKGHALHRLEALTDAQICPFPRKAVADMYRTAPRIAALLQSLSSIEQMELRERIHGLARLTAEERMSRFILTLQDRLAVATHGHSRRFRLPMTNIELGELLGLTDIYVGRTLRKLVDDGHISFADRHITVLDRQSWATKLGHKDLYAELDTSWYPAPK